MKSTTVVLSCMFFLLVALWAQPEQQKMPIIQRALVDDFLVNDDTTGGVWQGRATIAISGSGNFVMVWEDERNGNADIYFQRYDASGLRQGPNQQANDDTGIARQYLPSIAMDDSGNFVIAWADFRFGGNPRIYFQRYNSSGVRQGNNQQANDDSARVSLANRFSAVAMDGSGNFVIVWGDRRNGINNPDIYLQRYNSSGVKQGKNQKANDDTGSGWQLDPAIAMNGNGNFVIAWRGDGIWFQRYDAFGVKQGNNQKANEVAGQAWEEAPSIAMDGGGNFVITWNNYYNRTFDIYFQRYDSSGARQGNNQRVNNDAGSPRQYNPSVARDNSGNFAIAWQSEQIGQRYRYDLYLQCYDAMGGSRGRNQHVNDEAGSVNLGYQAIAMTSNGHFVIVWPDDRAGNSDIYFQRYDAAYARQGGNQQANDDVGSAGQSFPANIMDANGNFVIAWGDGRNDYTGDIYFQRYDSSGGRRGNNQRVNDEAESGGPSIAVDGSGNFVIVWGARRNGAFESDIYFQRYDSFGGRQGNKQKVNDDSDLGGGGAKIAMDRGGHFVIVWDDLRDENNDVYFQRYDASGVRQGNNQKVNDNNDRTTPQTSPAIVMDGNGNFVIVWEDGREGDSGIYFQRYDSSGGRQGNNQKVNDDANGGQQYPALAMDGDGNFVVAWEDRRDGNIDIYYQRYNSSGIKQGNNQKVNDDLGNAWNRFPSIAMANDGNFVIVWEDYRYDALLADIIGQRYYPDGSKRGGNYRIVADGPLGREERPVVTANSQQMVFSWVDYRRPAKGSDIFAKITTWDWEGVSAVDEQRQISENLGLLQNYPNPFNPSTMINFEIATPGAVSIEIFNQKGQLVKILVNSDLPAGKHHVEWNGKDDSGSSVSSGVYFYRMRSGKYSSTRKMVMMK